MALDPNEYILRARSALLRLGWVAEESFDDDGQCHLALIKGDDRIGWGKFDQIFCWSEAYRHITGRSWLELMRPDVVARN